jgi:hypothetical protein
MLRNRRFRAFLLDAVLQKLTFQSLVDILCKFVTFKGNCLFVKFEGFFDLLSSVVFYFFQKALKREVFEHGSPCSETEDLEHFVGCSDSKINVSKPCCYFLSSFVFTAIFTQTFRKAIDIPACPKIIFCFEI